MDKFSLDDVRDSFSSDMTEQVRAIAASAKALAETSGLEWRPEERGEPEFAAIRRACHTIYGTSSLVDVKSLYESARLLQIAASLGEECLRTIEDKLKLARALVVISRHGADGLGRMLTLELEHKGDEAWAEALHLREELARWDDARQELEARREREAAEELAERELRAARRDKTPVDAAAHVDPPAFDFGDDEGSMRVPGAAARASASSDVVEEILPPDAAPREEFSFEDDLAPPVAPPWPPSAAVGGAPPAVPAAPAEFSFDSLIAEPVAPPAAAPPASTRPPAAEFSFDDPAEGASSDLREIFQQEAREYLVALQGYLQALARDGGDLASAAALERIYHTLKGSAATVELTEVSAQAAGLQDTMEVAIARAQPLGPALLAQLVDRTNALLEAGGLPHVGLDGPAPAGDVRSPELQRLFWDDAAGVLAQIEEAVSQLDTAADREALIETLRALFHRLKGSAVVAAEFGLAETAGRLQDLCETGLAAAHPHELRRGVADLLRGLAHGHTPLPRLVEPPLREAIAMDVDPVILEAFEIEVGELLEAADRAIFALETSLTPKTEIAALFRLYHTLKGSVNTVGLAALGRLLHRTEDFLEELQDAAILPPLAHLASLLLNVQDEVRRNLRHAKKGFLEVNVARLDSEIGLLRAGGRPRSEISGRGPSSLSSAISGRSDTGTGGRPATSSRRERVADAAAFERKFVRVSTDRLDGLMNLTGELVVSRSRMARRVTALQVMHRELTLGRSRLVRAVDRFRDEYEFENVARHSGRREAARVPAGATASGATFGELELDRYGDVNILARSLADIGHDISQVQGRMTDSLAAFSEDAAGFGSIVAGLQVEITQARMVPVEQLFLRLRLPVRDAGEREGKDVRVQTFGEDVDLDKAIIDELYNPLLHLVRNAVAHGIERPDQRRTAGKPEAGTITLSARQEAGELRLDVQDDGAGLDYRRLQQMAVERGLVPAGTAADDPAVADIIFMSGVSTRAGVDDVSGRGLGCDVVRREIERLGGHIRVSSQPGAGTTFTITLPLTLAITRALVLRHRGQSYAVALNLSERIVDLQDANVHESAGVRRLGVDGVYHTLRSLDAVLGLPARGEDEEAARAAVLLRVGPNRLAVEVDRVVGQEEIVVKGLGDVLSGHPMFSGVTVSGDGELILILDVMGLFNKERHAEADSADRAVAGAPLGRARVLFVDDSLSVRKVAERFLTAAGAEVVLAADGEEGLEKLKTQGPFDIVFTDLEMPRRHGYDLIREARTIPALRHVPIVVVTSRSGQKHRDQAAAVGATDYLTKPFSQELLATLVRKWARGGAAS
jgi:chemosensory pili system protein ChpA (sensor histidine kinase/response regulator)